MIQLLSFAATGPKSRAWIIYAVFAAVLAARVVVEWAAVLMSGEPTSYGEGAVVHAGQIIARGGDPYASQDPGVFVSANYPPLGYLFVALGMPLGPFNGLRLANIVAFLALAGLIAWRARAARDVGLGLAASFLALLPVALWGASNRVDAFAVTLTAFAVVVAGTDWRRAAPAGILGALALYAKPTAALPLLAVLAYLVWRERPAAVRVSVAFVLAAIALLAVSLLRFDPQGLYRHLVVHNAFPFEPTSPALLVLVGALVLGSFAALGLRYGDARMRAYLLGAFGVVLLSGHEGATVNYLLDLSAAACLALAALARSRPAWATTLFAGQLLATFALTTVGPLAPPSLALSAQRVAAVAELPADRPYLAEDSGVLIAGGVEPVIDDLFVWARLVALEVIPDDLTARVRAREFAAVIADVRLDGLEGAAAYERLRWPAPLAEAVLEHYRLERVAPGSYRYLPRPDR